ncbi:MAG TPA: VWA domain-containing protein [Thermoanaerobaculia bacterium]|nr:VWA domain-containing protein [Thermoanaerobaculia bacterium]
MGSNKPAPPALPANLPQRYADWLEEVAPLINDDERAAFLALQQDYQRQAFIRAFWEARDPYPETPGNELRDAWQARVEAAREKYGTLADDRSRLLLLNGPPDLVLTSRCGSLMRPIEVWRVDHSSLVKGSFVLVFVARGGSRQGRYELWHPSEGIASLLLAYGGNPDDEALLDKVRDDCMQAEEMLSLLGTAVDWQMLEERGARPHDPGSEWVKTFAAHSTTIPADAALLPATLDVEFPARHQSRTVVQGVVRVPAAAAVAAGEKEEKLYRFLVDGEVLRKDELFESFRYRFEVPANDAPSQIPLLLERYLRPGDYRLLLRVEDLNGGSFFRHEGELSVPIVAAAPGTVLAQAPGNAGSTAADTTPATGATAGAAQATDATGTTAPVATAPGTTAAASLADDVVVQLAPPPADLITGRLRVAADVRGAGVARVRFVLDGQGLLAKARPPYTVELDLGQEPRLHQLAAIAEAPDGHELARDEVAVNAGPHRFNVRLVEPKVGTAVPGQPVRAEAIVEVPGGERLDRLELFVDETHLATLYQPPFVQSLLPPSGRPVSYVRAVAHLQSGAVAEDIAFLNAPRERAAVDVDLVELYTTANDRRGKPVTDLKPADFKVREDGRPQELLRCDYVEDLPIHAAVLLDTSSSMAEEMDQAVGAASHFFEQLLTSRDRAAVMSFADKPQLRVPFTGDPAVLAGGLARLEADGETALYDSVVYALWYFSGVRGKRVLVLLSDGEDSKSRYSFDETLEFARRSGVAIYTIGLGLSSNAQVARMNLQRLATETGGTAFFVERAGGFDNVYRSIERELRSQYLLAYQSDGSGTGYRKVEVDVKRPGVSVSTAKGYYP